MSRVTTLYSKYPDRMHIVHIESFCRQTKKPWLSLQSFRKLFRHAAGKVCRLTPFK